MSDEKPTTPASSDDNLVSLAPMLGLDALGAAERDSVARRRAKASDTDRAAFDRDVRLTREAMASVSSTTSATPPPELRDRLLQLIRTEPQDDAPAPRPAGLTAVDASRRPDAPADLSRWSSRSGAPADPSRWSSRSGAPAEDRVETTQRNRRFLYLAAAAIVAVAIGAVGWVVGANLSSDNKPQQTTAQQVFDAKDIRTSSGSVATGRATVAYSESADAGVLVMNDVPPPKSGTVYQMWLVGPEGATSAGTMTDKDVAPSTTAVIPHIGNAKALAFTVEPPGGSTTPTSSFVAELPLS
ncbi:anti-sigma factor [Gordonia sputi]|uniref:Regulator of SigK n=1 Tax=Gordonia sputi NBRC 100414 TaxID=1089453 RepID=H5U4A7_9ACTN|nr:anti-sigma factor [Gordonia sputi]NKY95236.1 anti-sigma factor [Gordonia sputi]GAB40565.1 anti-sigma-K factor RskA [Gordonia sputi NBRC 100414]